jgi:BirA family biotin operon repressor/biotin-[acetyl-CoA-carboxylase] ligase
VIAPHARRLTSAAPQPLAARVYARLALGGFHSGADLARALRVSRSAIWKATVSLRDLGVVVHAVRNRGYRLPAPCGALDAAQIRATLAREVSSRIRRLEAVWAVPSTNAALLARTDLPMGLADVMLAEYQSAGRGRRGRPWLAPPGGAVCLSLSWSFAQLPRDMSALGLAVGVCALRALHAHTAGEIGLKWPNDLILAGRKLGGILIEMRAEAGGPTYVVIGLGLNVSLGTALLGRIASAGTAAIDLRSAEVDPARRTPVIASLIEAMVRGLQEFEQGGLRPFLEEWRRADTLRGRVVRVLGSEPVIGGIARGIDTTGALLIETTRGLQKIISGEVSVRADE